MSEIFQEEIFSTVEHWEEWLKPMIVSYALERKQRISILGKVVDMLRRQMTLYASQKMMEDFETACKKLSIRIPFPYEYAISDALRTHSIDYRLPPLISSRIDTYRILAQAA